MFSAGAVLAAEDSPCRVDLIFASKDGGSLANYVLTLQVKNTTGRNINGVSVLYKDMSEAIIGIHFCSVAAKHKPSNQAVMVNVPERYKA